MWDETGVSGKYEGTCGSLNNGVRVLRKEFGRDFRVKRLFENAEHRGYDTDII